MSRLRGQAGETLVEVMMTVAIVSIAMVSIMAGIGASIRFSSSHRSSADAGLVVEAAAEAVKSWSGGGATCATLTAATYAPALTGLALPSGWSPADVAISAASCVTVNGVARPQVTVTATSPDGQSVESITVVRRSLT
jgi:type II secretory pathway pseudopilin PulG